MADNDLSSGKNELSVLLFRRLINALWDFEVVIKCEDSHAGVFAFL